MNDSLSFNRQPIFKFALALLKGGLNDPRTFVISLLTPLMLLTTFWVLTRTGENGAALMSFMFPSLVGFTVMLSGQALALRILNWQQQGIFQRLACTPVPLGHLVLGTALAQTLTAMLQGALVLLFGVLVLRLPVSALGAAAVVLALTLGSACFIAYGAVISTFVGKPETASAVFIFTLMPTYFLGGGLPPEVLPEFLRAVGQWLPTTLLTDLLHGLLVNGQLPEEPLRPILGLLAYTLVLTVIAARKFRWE